MAKPQFSAILVVKNADGFDDAMGVLAESYASIEAYRQRMDASREVEHIFVPWDTKVFDMAYDPPVDASHYVESFVHSLLVDGSDLELDVYGENYSILAEQFGKDMEQEEKNAAFSSWIDSLPDDAVIRYNDINGESSFLSKEEATTTYSEDVLTKEQSEDGYSRFGIRGRVEPAESFDGDFTHAKKLVWWAGDAVKSPEAWVEEIQGAKDLDELGAVLTDLNDQSAGELLSEYLKERELTWRSVVPTFGERPSAAEQKEALDQDDPDNDMISWDNKRFFVGPLEVLLSGGEHGDFLWLPRPKKATRKKVRPKTTVPKKPTRKP